MCLSKSTMISLVCDCEGEEVNGGGEEEGSGAASVSVVNLHRHVLRPGLETQPQRSTHSMTFSSRSIHYVLEIG